jgi:hypothetical protein
MPQLDITLGLHLDGQRAVTPAHRLGEAIVGPLGLLSILETQLGLLGEHPPQSDRIVQYRDFLGRADSPSRFYHASFATDELGTAATLLAWRDAWFLHGWAGVMPATAGKRLRDLADVEHIARGKLAPSLGERLERVLVAMQRRTPAIVHVRLLDARRAFAPRWQDVLEKLPVIEPKAPATPSGKNLLGQLQRNLLDAASGRSVAKIPWREDPSVTVVRAETRVFASAWLAARINDEPSSLLVATSDAARLDAALVRAGASRHGLSETSAFRPSLQVLPLALEILWEPINFHGLVQFLTHPICPVPGYARRQLAAKIADQPGIGGAVWKAVREEIAQHYGEDAAAVLEKVGFWVEHPRFAPQAGAPMDAVLDRVERLAEFFRLRLGDADAARRIANHAGFSQCRACADALRGLQGQGVTTIRPRQLQTLLAQATSQGSDNPLLVAEVGARLTITDPGAAVQPVDEVIWWQLAMPHLPAPYPWSAAEIRALAGAGVRLPSMDNRLAGTAQMWLRPILAARGKLVLVLPPMGEEVHPLWQMIEAVVERPAVLSLEPLLTQSSPLTHDVSHRALPAAKRWWQLPADVRVALRQKESYSSLELLLFNPYHWLLWYPAQLRSSIIVALGSDFRLLGNLAHGLIADLYQRPDALQMSDAAFAAWFGSAFMQRVTEEGAVLLMPGRRSDREGFRHRLL